METLINCIAFFGLVFFEFFILLIIGALFVSFLKFLDRNVFQKGNYS